MSPERFDPDRFGFRVGRATQESDCYAFGMVILEVLTGWVPFPFHNNLTVVAKIIKGERPERPQGAEAVWFTDDLWGMLEQCWSPQPEVRPTAKAMLKNLERNSMAWQPLHPTADDSLAHNDGDLQADNHDDPQADDGDGFQADNGDDFQADSDGGFQMDSDVGFRQTKMGRFGRTAMMIFRRAAMMISGGQR